MPPASAAATPPTPPSLRSRVLRHVLWPLALTWVAGTVIVAFTANRFAGQAFDRSLLDDAYLVAANVTHDEDGLELALTPREVGSVLFDQSETMRFAVLRADGSLLAGDRVLRALPVPTPQTYVFSETMLGGQPYRVVTVRRTQPFAFDVVLAQTTHSREALLNRLLLFAVVPQVLLLLLLAWWLRRAIGTELRPLALLQQAVDQRDASDLRPVAAPATTAEVARLGTALNSLLSRLDGSIRAQREFAGNVAHELRTPLAGIRALADYGLAQASPDIWREQLQRIAASQGRASHLVDQLLALALADEAGAAMQMAPLRLDLLVRELLLRQLTRADAAGADLGASGLDVPVTVLAQPDLIEGVLNNLVDNALRYGCAPDASGAVITVALAVQAGEVRLTVTDQGPGIAPEAQQQLRTRWAQGKAGERLGVGAGLGLAIVARYAELMGARLLLGSGPEGRGLVAGLVFPAAQAPDQAANLSR